MSASKSCKLSHILRSLVNFLVQAKTLQNIPMNINKQNLMRLIVHAFQADWLQEYHGHHLEVEHITALLDSKKCDLDVDDHPIKELCTAPHGKAKKGRSSSDVVVQAVVGSEVLKTAQSLSAKTKECPSSPDVPSTAFSQVFYISSINVPPFYPCSQVSVDSLHPRNPLSCQPKATRSQVMLDPKYLGQQETVQ